MTFVVCISMPKGARPMNELDIRRVKWGAQVDVLDTHTGQISHTTAQQDAKDGSLVVKFRGGHIATLGAADVDGQFVPVTVQLADELEDPNNAMAVAGRIRVLEESLKRQADALQAMPSREQYEAMMTDVTRLQEDYRVLRLVRSA